MAHFPADGYQFVKLGTVDQVEGVMLAIPVEIVREGVGVDWILRDKVSKRLRRQESCFRKFVKLVDQRCDRYRFG